MTGSIGSAGSGAVSGDAEAALRALLTAARAQIADDPAMARFAEGVLPEDPALTLPEPLLLPPVAHLAAHAALAAPLTRPLAEAILAAAPHLRWLQSYDAEEVGAHFLAHYAWFNLVSPEGPFLADAIKISVGFWGAGLHYPRHWHEPAEIYCVIAGGARFLSEGQPDAYLGPGGIREHAPNDPHSAAMEREPLVAMALWKGAGLVAKSTLDLRDVA